MAGRRTSRSSSGCDRAALRHRLPFVLAALAAFATATTFAPWAASGERSRSSHQLVDVAERAGILTDSAAPMAVVWYLGPLLLEPGAVVGGAAGGCTIVAATAVAITAREGRGGK